MTNTKDRVADATANVRPYIERAIRDEELRGSVRSAYASARALYDQLLAKDDVADVATKLASDEHLHDEVRNVISQLRRAAARVQTAGDAAESSGRRKARNGLILLAGIALGLLFNPLSGPPLRRWLKRKLFGGGGFVYDSNGRGVS